MTTKVSAAKNLEENQKENSLQDNQLVDLDPDKTISPSKINSNQVITKRENCEEIHSAKNPESSQVVPKINALLGKETLKQNMLNKIVNNLEPETLKAQ